ncbi:MAG: hypothetical protein WCL08_00370 [Verrucomicrobiota bacterium]
MSTTATDAFTVSTAMICRSARIHRNTVYLAIKSGLLPEGRKRRGVAGTFWTPAQANRFLKLRGHTGEFFKD